MLITVILGCGVGIAGVTAILAQVNGHMIFSVSQPLTVEKISWYDAGPLPPEVPDTISHPNVSAPDRQMAAISDDGTGFSAAAEISTGDQVALQLYIKNHGKQPVFGQLEFKIPEGLSIEVYAPKDSSIRKVARISPGKWIIRILSDISGINTNYVNIVIAASDATQSISTIQGELTQVTQDRISFDLNIGGGDTAATIFNIAGVAPGDSGISYTELENVGDLSGILDIEFSGITESGGTGGGEYGDGIGNLGNHLEIAAYIDVDQSGDWNSGDIGLNTDNLTYSYPTPLEYDLIIDYGNDIYSSVKVMVPLDVDDFVILWRVASDTGNNIQGDSVTLNITFILNQESP